MREVFFLYIMEGTGIKSYEIFGDLDLEELKEKSPVLVGGPPIVNHAVSEPATAYRTCQDELRDERAQVQVLSAKVELLQALIEEKDKRLAFLEKS